MRDGNTKGTEMQFHFKVVYAFAHCIKLDFILDATSSYNHSVLALQMEQRICILYGTHQTLAFNRYGEQLKS